MLKRTLAAVLVLGLGIWSLSSCGGSSAIHTTPNGTLYTFIGDVPFCNVTNFRSDVSGLTLYGLNGSPSFSVFPTASRSPFYKINFGGLRDFTTLLDIGSVPVGTYYTARVTFSIGEISLIDFTKNPPISTLNGVFTNTTPIVNISPPLVVSENTVSGLAIDFNMAQSLELDSQGNITGGVRPSLTVSTVTPTAIEGFGEMDDMTGFITSVRPQPTPDTSFAGGFSLQTLSGSGPLLSVDLVNSTQICGFTAASNNPPVPACAPVVSPPCTMALLPSCSSAGATPIQYIYLNQLLTGSLVEMDAYTDSNGNLIANTVQVEDQEIVEDNKVGVIGTVASVTRDQNGKATQFTMYVRELEPDSETQVSPDEIVTVNLDPTTVYRCTTCGLQPSLWQGYPAFQSIDFAGLPFDATAIAPGQELIVHGVATKPPSSDLPTTIADDPQLNLLLTVYLKIQSQQGNFTSLVTSQPDDRTGAFWMASCSALFQGAPILVATNAQTNFVNAAGLTTLSSQSPLLVKGLVFYERNSTTVNGVTVPAGTLVLLAKQVHAL